MKKDEHDNNSTLSDTTNEKKFREDQAESTAAQDTKPILAHDFKLFFKLVLRSTKKAILT
jgi:hypothetical protein